MWLARGVCVAVAVALLAGCGNSGASGVSEGKGISWGVIRPCRHGRLWVGGGMGYCVGTLRPFLKVREMFYQGNNLYMGLEVSRPKAKSRSKRPKNWVCAGVELRLKRKITLRRNLSEAEVYNVDVDPPDKVWPR